MRNIRDRIAGALYGVAIGKEPLPLNQWAMVLGFDNEEEDDDQLFDEQKCRVCGCTWDNACEGGCYWVEEDLCSKCAEKMKEE